MDYTEVKLIAVWSGPKAPPSQLKLSDYKLPVAGRIPKNFSMPCTATAMPTWPWVNFWRRRKKQATTFPQQPSQLVLKRRANPA